MITLRKLTILVTLILAGCGIASILQLIDTAASIAIQAASVAGVVPPIYVNAVEGALTGLDCAATELATSDTGIDKARKVTACLTGALAQLTGITGLSPALQTIITDLINAIDNVLAGLPKATALKATPAVPSGDDIRHLEATSLKLRGAAEMLKTRLQ